MSQHIVIAGGGIIGAATAYYLALKGSPSIVVEATRVACSSSGKAGGFLALDWCDTSVLGPLARKSFQLHKEVAESLGSDAIGYRSMTTHGIELRGGSAAARRRRVATAPEWIDAGNVQRGSVIGTTKDTAQVHPELLTKALLKVAEERTGARVMEGTEVIGLVIEEGTLKGVRVKNFESGVERIIPADAVVFALGAWSSRLNRLLPEDALAASPSIEGLKVHSIVVGDSDKIAGADALFLSYEAKSGSRFDPEVYPRPDKTIYCCGISSEENPPPRADDIEIRPDAINSLKEVMATVNQKFSDAPLLKQQACFLPCSDDGIPLIGQIPNMPPGCYLATGHSCWGILLSLATGLALSEVIIDGASTTINLEPFDPARRVPSPM